MSELRVRKMQEFIKQEVGNMLLRELKDPRPGFVTVTGVKLTGDLREATVYVSLFGQEEERKEEKKEKRGSSLTVTECEILKLMALGKTTKEIAAERFLSVYTVMTHRKNIFRKLEVNNVYEATKYALRAGIVDAVEYYI